MDNKHLFHELAIAGVGPGDPVASLDLQRAWARTRGGDLHKVLFSGWPLSAHAVTAAVIALSGVEVEGLAVKDRIALSVFLEICDLLEGHARAITEHDGRHLTRRHLVRVHTPITRLRLAVRVAIQVIFSLSTGAVTAVGAISTVEVVCFAVEGGLAITIANPGSVDAAGLVAVRDISTVADRIAVTTVPKEVLTLKGVITLTIAPDHVYFMPGDALVSATPDRRRHTWRHVVRVVTPLAGDWITVLVAVEHVLAAVADTVTAVRTVTAIEVVLGAIKVQITVIVCKEELVDALVATAGRHLSIGTQRLTVSVIPTKRLAVERLVTDAISTHGLELIPGNALPVTAKDWWHLAWGCLVRVFTPRTGLWLTVFGAVKGLLDTVALSVTAVGTVTAIKVV